MKRGGERRGGWGEGGMVAAALCLVLAFSLAVYMARIPPERTVEPVHSVPYEELRRMEMININTASVEEISRIPGVGATLAGRIIARREEFGPFASLEELLLVDGIGEGKLEEMRSMIYLD